MKKNPIENSKFMSKTPIGEKQVDCIHYQKQAPKDFQTKFYPNSQRKDQ